MTEWRYPTPPRRVCAVIGMHDIEPAVTAISSIVGPVISPQTRSVVARSVCVITAIGFRGRAWRPPASG